MGSVTGRRKSVGRIKEELSEEVRERRRRGMWAKKPPI
jgi:hypothetical protein